MRDEIESLSGFMYAPSQKGLGLIGIGGLRQNETKKRIRQDA
jgi:hypothetical protein